MLNAVAYAVPLPRREVKFLYPLLSDHIYLGVTIAIEEFCNVSKRHFVVSIIVNLSLVMLVVVTLARYLTRIHATGNQDLVMKLTVFLIECA